MTHCDTCEADVPTNAPRGLCPRCLFQVALDETVDERGSEEAPEIFPIPFGKCDLLERSARGGMGVVYRARERGLDRDVALKVIRSGDLASKEEKDRFKREAKTAASLKHPNIVRVLDSGVHQGLPYFTLELIEGKNLAQVLPELRHDPDRVAGIMALVSQAVSYAHRRGILHRDLKPANILIDAHGTPHVTDFGLAMHIGHESRITRNGDIVGTLPYMSPEQATGPSEELTTRSDVYSLGAILYELLTGRPPIAGRTMGELLGRLQREEPIPPRKLDRSIPADLEAVCLRCLEKDPDRRCSSAILVENMKRVIDGDPIPGTPVLRRLSKWFARRPGVAAAGAEVALFLVVAIAASFSVTAAQADDRRQEVLRTNVYAARTLAGSVLAQLKDYRDAMAQAAADFPPALAPDLLQPWTRPEDGTALERYCQELYARYDDPDSGLRQPGGPSPFNTWFVLDKEGIARARWPVSPREFRGRNYLWRDYYQGALAIARTHGHSVHVSRAFLSESHGTLKFAFSAPLYGPDKAFIGVMVAMADSGGTLGSLRMSDLNDEHRTAVLVAPRDHTRELAEAGAPFPSDHAILVHDSLRLGQITSLESARVREVVARAAQGAARHALQQLRLTGPEAVAFDEDHRDPMQGYEGRWLAGFAPVGNTGFVVIVQTPYDAASRPNQTLARRLVPWGGVYLGLAAIPLAGLLILRRRTRRK